MTDYYDPESWDGIATHADHPGVVVAVDIAEWNVSHDSGKTEKHRTSEPGEACERCGGLGADPSEWTLVKARETPEAYHKELLDLDHGPGHRVVALLPNVVSPAPFLDNGKLRCRNCAGRGHDVVLGWEDGETWPTFQANPAHRKWHVERKGTILASGVGLKACRAYGEEGKAGVAKIIARIEKAIAKAEKPNNPKPNNPGPRAEASADYSPGVEIGEYKGHPTISLPTGGRRPFSFGLAKARIILGHVEDIRRFVEEKRDSP